MYFNICMLSFVILSFFLLRPINVDGSSGSFSYGDEEEIIYHSLLYLSTAITLPSGIQGREEMLAFISMINRF